MKPIDTPGRRGATVGVVQARTTSTRLPGKVLLPLENQPMVLRQLDRLKRSETVDTWIVATSNDKSDDDLTAVLEHHGVAVVRGPLNDVLARFILAVDATECDVVVRITADCPLICPVVLDEIVLAFHESDAAYLSNTMVATYPDGLDVEVTTANILRLVANESTDRDEREHVTLGIYRQQHRFSIENYRDPTGRNNSAMRWTVDTREDFEFVNSVYRVLCPKNPDFRYADVLRLLKEHPELDKRTTPHRRNSALDGLDVGAMRHAEPDALP